MKQFNLEKALAGEPVITRDGTIVKEIKLFDSISILDFPLGANINGQIYSFTISGKYSRSKNEYDLFMDSEEHTFWANIYLEEKKHYNVGGLHNTYEEALAWKNRSDEPKYIDTIEIKFKH